MTDDYECNECGCTEHEPGFIPGSGKAQRCVKCGNFNSWLGDKCPECKSIDLDKTDAGTFWNETTIKQVHCKGCGDWFLKVVRIDGCYATTDMWYKLVHAVHHSVDDDE